MNSATVQYIGGTPQPVFETLIVLVVMFFLTSIYFGKKYSTTDVGEYGDTRTGKEELKS